MKKLILGALIAGYLAAGVGVSQAAADCVVKDSKGKRLPDASCLLQWALLEIRKDEWLRVTFDRNGFERNDGQARSFYEYYEGATCQGEPLFFSYTKTYGYFFELPWTDGETFNFASMNKRAVKGDQPISFIGDDVLNPVCYQLNTDAYRDYYFAPIETRRIDSFKFVPPFRIE